MNRHLTIAACAALVSLAACGGGDNAGTSDAAADSAMMAPPVMPDTAMPAPMPMPMDSAAAAPVDSAAPATDSAAGDTAKPM